MSKTIDHERAGQVIVVPESDGETIWLSGDTYTLLLTGRQTSGRMLMWHALVPPSAGPPLHIHLREDEMYYVLSGEIEVFRDTGYQTVSSGSAVFIPRGTVHAFRNAGTADARMLIWMSPAGFEGFLTGVGRPATPGVRAPAIDEAERARSVAGVPDAANSPKHPFTN
jgi:mannose-6-phosphate isomerase-like protein (cupin superfamily)